MKILCVTSEIPYPPESGTTSTTFNIMRLMANANHNLALAVLSDRHDCHDIDGRMAVLSSYFNQSFIEVLPSKSQWATAFISLITGRMYFMERYRDKQFGIKLRDFTASFCPDVVYFDLIRMCQYRKYFSTKVGTVASINDSYSRAVENALKNGEESGARRWARKIQLWQARIYERKVYSLFDVCHTIANVDADYLRGLNPQINAVPIPNGVDLDMFFPNKEVQSKSFDIIYVAKLLGGNLESLKNFLLESWPLVRKKFPLAKLKVVGRVFTETKTIFPLAERLGGIEFLGYVDDIGEVYRSVSIAIVPVNKRGIMTKVIEAMVSGLCVVAYHKAFADITKAEIGSNCIGVDSYQEMGKCICNLFSKRHRMLAIQKEACKIRDDYDWKSQGLIIEKMFEEAVNRQRDDSMPKFFQT